MVLLGRRVPARPIQLRVGCPCGQTLSAAAGEAVWCPCGRGWETASVPTRDLTSLARSVRRLRVRQLGFVASVLVAVATLVVLRSSVPGPVLGASFVVLWVAMCRPWWRARRAPTVVGAPRWELTAIEEEPSCR